MSINTNVMRNLIDTRDVIFNQVATLVAQTDDLDADAKRELTGKVNQIMIQQFNNLVDRVQAASR